MMQKENPLFSESQLEFSFFLPSSSLKPSSIQTNTQVSLSSKGRCLRALRSIYSFIKIECPVQALNSERLFRRQSPEMRRRAALHIGKRDASSVVPRTILHLGVNEQHQCTASSLCLYSYVLVPWSRAHAVAPPSRTWPCAQSTGKRMVSWQPQFPAPRRTVGALAGPGGMGSCPGSRAWRRPRTRPVMTCLRISATRARAALGKSQACAAARRRRRCRKSCLMPSLFLPDVA